MSDPIVIAVTPKWSTTEGGIEGTGEPGSVKRPAVLGFDILASAVGLSVEEARVQAYSFGMPKYGSPHPTETFSTCRGVAVRQKAPLLFEGICRFEGPGLGKDDKKNDSKPPWLQPPKVRWSTVTTEVNVDEDVHGKPIQTVAKEPIIARRRQ